MASETKMFKIKIIEISFVFYVLCGELPQIKFTKANFSFISCRFCNGLINIFIFI